MKPVLLQPAFILHKRDYRETSCLIDVLTCDYGRCTLVAKGVRQKTSNKNGLLQSLTPLFISWTGKSELKTLSHVEMQTYFPLTGDCLFAGFYLNELLISLLQPEDPYPNLYHAYQDTLVAFHQYGLKEKFLRSFEKQLLDELGYGLLPTEAILLHNTIMADKYYRFVPGEGLILSESISTNASPHLFFGETLLKIANEDWSDENCLKAAKRLMRMALLALLGEKILHSRRLFLNAKLR